MAGGCSVPKRVEGFSQASSEPRRPSQQVVNSCVSRDDETKRHWSDETGSADSYEKSRRWLKTQL